MKYFLIFFAAFFSAFLVLPTPQAYAQCGNIPGDVEIATHTDISCFGANDGTITVDLFATTLLATPYNFELYDLNLGVLVTATVTETEDIANRRVVYTDVPPGNYTVRLYKAGCPGNPRTIVEMPAGEFIVAEPAALTITLNSTDPDCDPAAGTGNGQIDLTVSGGTLPYTITWTGPTAIPNGTEVTAGNLDAGSYTINVLDANNCPASLVINVPITTQADAGPATALVCGTNSHGLSANAAGAGEVGTWSGPAGVTFSNVNDPNATVTNLNVGANVLTWTIQDIAMLCPGNSDNITVTYSNVLISGSPTVLLDCFGDSDGTGTFTVTGGSANYSYTLLSNTAGATITLPPAGATTSVGFTNASQGVVTLQVLDGNGCTSQATITINQPTAITPSVTGITNVSCSGGATGAIDISVSGGTPGYTYLWSNGATTQDVSGLIAGTYNVTITDANGCTASLTNISVIQPTPVNPSVTSVTNVLCAGGATGAIDISVSGGTPGYTYLWSNGATTQDVTGLIAGTYSVNITDANGCTASLTNINVAQPTAINPSVTSVTNVLCNGGTTGAIDISVSGGTPGYTYLWSNGATTQDVTGLIAGTYSVTITDANGCTASLTNISVAQPTAINRSVTTITNVLCNGGATGAIDITVSGGTPGYTYLWSNGATTQDVTGLTAGTYSVTITDANGCSTSLTNISVTQPSPISASVTSVTNVLCNGGATGAINITVSGGTAGYTYVWSNGATTQDLSGIIAGTYSVTITDANGCTTSLTNINVTQPTALSASVTSVTNVLCNGGATGAIDISVSGGTAGYTYSWSNGATTQDVTGLNAGTYSVTVTDANGCTFGLTNINVTQPTALNASVTTITNVLCNGGATGAIDITVSGGTTAYNYLWSNGATTQDISGLIAGTYSVTITDANGCTANLTNINVTQPAGMGLSSSVTDNTNCTAFDGAIDLTVTGGTAPLTFDWSGPNGFVASTEDITGLEPGNYDILVTDNNGCTANATITVGDNAPTLTVTPTTVTDNTNCTPFNGAIDITVTGSAGPFTFDWTGPNSFTAATEDLTALEPGTYDVIVTDNVSGCTGNASIVVDDLAPTLTIPTSTVTDNTRCITPFNGAVDITVSGTSGPFTFDWVGPNGFTAATEDISGLEPGDYDITVTDNATGCTVFNTYSVSDNIPTLSLSSAITDNTRCIAAFNGAINITVSGAPGPFTFSWSGPNSFSASTEDITALEPGDYVVDVTDNISGCVLSELITVGDLSAPPSVSVTVVDNDRCNAPFNGAILLNVTPASAYSFLWTGPNAYTSTSEDITSLEPGLYQVLVTNLVSGCTTIENASVNDNAPSVTVSADAISDNSSCTAPFNGAILITASPAGTYTYSWVGPNGFTSSSEDLSALENGDYTVTATNTALGCADVQTFTVGDNTVTINLTSQTITDNSNCQAPFNGAISVTAGGTVGPYSFSWTGPNGFSATGASIAGLESGDYDVTITDLTLSCSDTYTLTVGDATPPISITLDATAPNTSCLAPFTGSLDITASGTAGPYTFLWSGPNSFSSTSEDIAALENGDYDVTVTDSGLGCTATATFTVADGRPTVTVSVVTVNANTSCVAPFNGDLTISVGGTAGPFTITWAGPSAFVGTGTFNGSLEPGDYTLTATDDVLGCETISVITVPDAAPVIIATPVITGNSNCLAPFNGAIDITTGGTAGPFTFLWSGPTSFSSTSEDITALEPGDYDLQVTDSNLGCVGLFTFTVPQNATTVSIVMQSVTPNTSCVSPFNGALDVTIGGTPGPYTISWTGPGAFSSSNEDISALAPGNYVINVTDNVLGCTANATFNVPNAATGCGGLNCFAFITSITDTRPTCANQDDGTITINVSGGTPNYIVTLSAPGFFQSLAGPAGNFTFSNLSPANYQYTLLDVSGNFCTLPYSLPIQTNIDASASNIVDADCFGDATGQATITVDAGGTSPFDYSVDGSTWVTSVTSPISLTNLPMGTYSILVRDDASDLCPDQVLLTIGSVNSQIDIGLTTDAATCGNSDGAINITTDPSGAGGGPYTYQIDGNTATPTGNVFGNQSGGNHTVTVIDGASGCQRDFAVTVPFPGFVSTGLISSQSGNCGGGGVISFDILSAGTGYEVGYTTDFFTEATNYFSTPPNVTIPDLPRGNYYVWVRSATSQCPTRINSTPIFIDGPYEVSFEIGCREVNGDLALRNIAGAPGITFNYEVFQNGFTNTGTVTVDVLSNAVIPGFTTGAYQVRLSQDQSPLGACLITTAFQTAPTAALDITSVTVKESFPDQPTGTMQIKIQESGSEPYEVWLVENSIAFYSDTIDAIRNPVIFEANFTAVPSGTFSVYVEDARGCRREVTQEVPFDGTIFVPNIFTPNNDGLNEQFYVRNLPASGSKLVVTNRWGKEVYSSGNYNPENLWDGGGTPDGIYYYRLQIKGGPTLTGWVEILRGTKP